LQTYIHSNGYDHQSLVELDQWLVLDKSVLFQEALLNSIEEVPVQAGIDYQDYHLRDLVPDLIDIDKSISNQLALATHCTRYTEPYILLGGGSI
jgi:hypothetical protein